MGLMAVEEMLSRLSQGELREDSEWQTANSQMVKTASAAMHQVVSVPRAASLREVKFAHPAKAEQGVVALLELLAMLEVGGLLGEQVRLVGGLLGEQVWLVVGEQALCSMRWANQKKAIGRSTASAAY
jgi:hypothetical protein